MLALALAYVLMLASLAFVGGVEGSVELGRGRSMIEEWLRPPTVVLCAQQSSTYLSTSTCSVLDICH